MVALFIICMPRANAVRCCTHMVLPAHIEL